MKCDFCGWKSPTKLESCPNCNRKYSDSNVLRKARKAFFISMLVFVLGPSLIVFVADSELLMFVLIMGLFGQFLFFAIRFSLVKNKFYGNFEKGKQRETVSGHKDRIVLPTKPVSLAPESGFVYSGLKEELESCVEQVFSVYDIKASFDVKYRGDVVMEFWLANPLNEVENTVIHTIAIQFYPTRFSNSDQVMERFMKCGFYDDFEVSNNFADVEYGIQQGMSASASYGMDVEKAMRVASYILSNVCYIPIDTKFTYDWCWFYDPTCVSSIFVKTAPAVHPIENSPDGDLVYPVLEDAVQSFAKTVFSIKGGNGQMTIHHKNDDGLMCGEDVFLYLNFYRFDAGYEKENSISILYTCVAGQTRRFMQNRYINDFTIVRNENDGAMERAIANYGQDVSRVSKVVSYILADVFRIPIDAELEYEGFEINCQL